MQVPTYSLLEKSSQPIQKSSMLGSIMGFFGGGANEKQKKEKKVVE